MRLLTIFLFGVSVLLLSSKQSESADNDFDCNAADLEMYAESHPERIRCRDLQESDPEPNEDQFSGEWKIENGELICDGFLIRRSDKDFCSASVPEDWERFSYNGKTYYIQPLS
jgi:hypothetical protein